MSKKASQQHGFEFENQVKANFSNYLKLFDIDYTEKWDIPPVSVKSFNFKNGRIEFGSIENMFKIDSNFFLVLVGYEQDGNIKRVVYSDILLITKNHLVKMKGMLRLEELEKLSEILKSYKEGEHELAQEWYKSIKGQYEIKTMFQINFKVDSKKQRRIQCSMNIETLYRAVGIEPVIENKLCIADIESDARIRNKKE